MLEATYEEEIFDERTSLQKLNTKKKGAKTRKKREKSRSHRKKR